MGFDQSVVRRTTQVVFCMYLTTKKVMTRTPTNVYVTDHSHYAKLLLYYKCLNMFSFWKSV